MEKVVVSGLEFEVKEVKLIVRRGREDWLLVGIEKDGKMKKFIMREVERWVGEKKEVKMEDVGL